MIRTLLNKIKEEVEIPLRRNFTNFWSREMYLKNSENLKLSFKKRTGEGLFANDDFWPLRFKLFLCKANGRNFSFRGFSTFKNSFNIS